MIALLEEEYDSASQKYVLHLTMDANDTVADLPSSTRPFNSSNYSCSFDYGEPAEGSTAVNEVSGKLYTYGDGEWYEPQPSVEPKILMTALSVSKENNNTSLNGTPVGVGTAIDDYDDTYLYGITVEVKKDDVISQVNTGHGAGITVRVIGADGDPSDVAGPYTVTGEEQAIFVYGYEGF